MPYVPTSIRFCVLWTLAILLWMKTDVRAGRFEGKMLVIDTATEIAPPIVNDGVRSLPSVAAGEVLTFDLFIRDADGLSIEGLSLAFQNAPLSGGLFTFTSFFDIQSIEGLIGQTGEARGPLVSVFNGGGRTIGANGYIGTVKLRALQDIGPGTTVRIEAGRTRVIDGLTGESDSVDVQEATFLIANTDFDVSLDLDTTPGDQAPNRLY